MNCLQCLILNGEEIEFVNNFKYPGIILDSSLIFKNQTQNTIKTASHQMSLLNKRRNHITEAAATQIYKTMILPYFDYGDVITYNLPD